MEAVLLVIVICVAGFFVGFLLLYTRRRQYQTVKPPTENTTQKTVHEPCPWCGTKEYSTANPAFTCGECGTVHHLRCWQEYGGCAIWDCRLAPSEDANETVLK